MREDVLHEVATPLQQLKVHNTEWGEVLADNDDSYQNYCRLLRNSYHIAWNHHDCSYCKDLIQPGDEYSREVYLSRNLGKKEVFVVKKHYPECPRDREEREEEMYRDWEREDNEAQGTNREAA